MEVLLHKQVFIIFFLKVGSLQELLFIFFTFSFGVLLGEDFASLWPLSFVTDTISILFIWNSRN